MMSFILPTSINQRHFCTFYFYQNHLLRSPILLYHMANQCKAYVIFICYSMFYGFFNLVMIAADPGFIASCNFTNETTNETVITNQTVTLQPPASISTVGYNLRLSTAILMPSCWVCSYLLLWLFYKLDHGFFSQSNVEYVYYNRGDKTFILFQY